MLQNLLNVTIVIFMVGNLLEVGLRLQVADALSALRNVRFVVLSLVWCFVLGPALAVLLTKLIPLAEPYALGLVILGLTPCSPAIPLMMRKSGGRLAYMSAFMLMAYVGTVVLMPFMAPWLAQGFTADPWTIAEPLVLFIAIPLVIGAVIRRAAEAFAETAAPVVKTVTSLNTIILCVIMLWIYRSDLFSAVGTYAIGTQILYYVLLGFGSYLFGLGLSYDQKAPMVLGTCTRNGGPALATLMGVADAPQGAVTMCIRGATMKWRTNQPVRLPACRQQGPRGRWWQVSETECSAATATRMLPGRCRLKKTCCGQSVSSVPAAGSRIAHGVPFRP